MVEGLATETPKQDVVVWGSPAKIAFDADGNEQGAEAFAKKNGIEVSALETDNDGKADKLVFRTQSGGESTKACWPVLLNLP